MHTDRGAVFTTTLAMVAALSGGCTQAAREDAAESLGSVAAALVNDNGVELQGVELQGIELQGIELQGVELQGTQLTGTLTGGGLLSGDDFIGTTMEGVLSNGGTLALRIDSIEPSADPEVDLYAVSYLSGGEWLSLCGASPAGPVRAVPLRGQWSYAEGAPGGGDHLDDPTLITFACAHAVLAKCAVMGYKPWKTVTECKSGYCVARSLRDLHQACTRMMRADYCGDGAPHTKNGNAINVWDNFAIQERENDLGDDEVWEREAEWTSDGAMCVKSFRWNNQLTSDYVDKHCPERKSPGGVNCFGKSSTFFTKYGYTTPMASRVLLRNEALQLDGDDD